MEERNKKEKRREGKGRERDLSWHACSAIMM
jgi:hypothetical protein